MCNDQERSGGMVASLGQSHKRLRIKIKPERTTSCLVLGFFF